MVHHLSGGRWGYPVRRFYEAGIMTIPLMALLFVPVCFGLRDLYLWTDAHAVAMDPVLRHRSQYMTAPLFMIRAAVFFIIWSGAALALNKWSFQQEGATDVEPTRKLRAFSGPGIVLYPLTATFVLIDWIMSLKSDWYSTMFAVLIIIGQMLAGLAFSIIILVWLHKSRPFSDTVTPTHFHHLGMLLFAFIMLWTYMAFSQLLIIYSGNLPHEILWYRHRIAGDWIGGVVPGPFPLCHSILPSALPRPQAECRRAGDAGRGGPLRASCGRILVNRSFVLHDRRSYSLA